MCYGDQWLSRVIEMCGCDIMTFDLTTDTKALSLVTYQQHNNYQIGIFRASSQSSSLWLASPALITHQRNPTGGHEGETGYQCTLRNSSFLQAVELSFSLNGSSLVPRPLLQVPNWAWVQATMGS